MDNYLDDVPEDKNFFLGDKRIKNLYGLLFELRSMSDENYSYYADSNHNYFADWIQHVIGYKGLADDMRKMSSRKESISMLEKSIELIKKQNEKPSSTEIVVVEQPKEEIKGGFVVSDITQEDLATAEYRKQKPKIKKIIKVEPPKITKTDENELLLRKISENEREVKEFLWKHFTWDMAKEFMYGMAIGILIGLVLSKIFIKV